MNIYPLGQSTPGVRRRYPDAFTRTERKPLSRLATRYVQLAQSRQCHDPYNHHGKHMHAPIPRTAPIEQSYDPYNSVGCNF